MADQSVQNGAQSQDPKLVAFVRSVAWDSLYAVHGEHLSDGRILEIIDRNLARLDRLSDEELSAKLLMELDADELPRA